MTDVEILRSIESVDAFEWDDLDSRGGRSSHGFLLVTEESALVRGARRYFIVRDARGISAAAICEVNGAEDGDTIDPILFGRFAPTVQRSNLAVTPALVCGASSGRSDPVLVRRDITGSHRDALIDRLIDALESEARERNWSLCVRGLDASQSDLGARLRTRGYLHARNLPISRLDLLGWSDFDAYRRHLKQIHPSTEQSIRNEANRARRAGVRVERLHDAVGEAARLHRLLDRHYRRLNGVPFPHRPEIFASLEKHVPGHSIVWVVRDASGLIGVLIGVRGRHSLDLPWVGLAPDRNLWGAPYFNLVYHAPIREAIADGLHTIYYGSLLYDTKVRRGCALVDSDIRIRPRGPVHGAFLRPMLLAQRARVARLTAGYPRHRESV